MVLQRWDPMYDFRRIHEAMNRRWRDSNPAFAGAERKGWAIPVDVVEEGDELLVRASIPGVKTGDIEVSIEDHVLTIKAETKFEEETKSGGYLMRERRAGAFRRSLRLPDTVDSDNAKTLYDNGVLTVTLPKVESKKARRLEVTEGKPLKA